MIFSPPSELEFIDRGFGFSPAHDPDEAVISYVRTYPEGRELVLTFAIGSMSSLHVVLSQSSISLSEMTLECVRSFSFQSWHGERIFRVNFEGQFHVMDLRVHYDSFPSIHLASLTSGA